MTAYESTLSGEIEISPPLVWGEFREFAFDDDAGIEFRVDESRHERDEGTITVKYATAIIPAEGDRHYSTFTQLARVLKAFDKPGRTWTGWLDYDGADRGDVMRFGVVEQDGKLVAVEQRAALLWPDGTREPHPFDQ